MRGAREARYDIELQSRRKRTGEIAVEKPHTSEVAHHESHQARCDRIESDRRVRYLVLAEPAVPRDDASMDFVRLRRGQAHRRRPEHQRRNRAPVGQAFEPPDRMIGADGRFERALGGRRQRARPQRAPLHRPHGDERRQRIGRHTGRVVEPDVERRMSVRRIGAADDRCLHRVRAARDRDVLEQGAERDLARPAVDVVQAPVARVEAMHDEAAIVEDLEAPRLRVVAAWRPARDFEDRFDHPHRHQRRN